MSWIEYIIAFVAFFVSHAVPVRPPLRPWLVARVGERGFTLFYSLVSLCVLAWLVLAAGRAPHLTLWDYEPWQNLVPLAAMFPVCVIVTLAIGRPNPFSFGGANNGSFDPERPGLVRWMRHPLLVALAVWALAHLVPNGDLAHVLLFGVFAVFAFVGQRLVDQRRQRELGAHWDRLRLAVSQAPRSSPPFGTSGFVLRIAAGLLLYAVLLLLHPFLFGVDPLP